MGWFRYKCCEHGEFVVSLEGRAKTQLCPICNMESKAVLKPGTLRVTEILDNGVMVKRVERLHNIEEIMDERNASHSVKQDEED